MLELQSFWDRVMLLHLRALQVYQSGMNGWMDVVLANAVVFPFLVSVTTLQHQQQVIQAVERAKQVTMSELNAIIGVRGLHNLSPVCFSFLLQILARRAAALMKLVVFF